MNQKLKKIMIILSIVLVIELIGYFIYRKLNNDVEIESYEIYNKGIIVDDNYVFVGSSNEIDKDIVKSKISIVNKDLKTIKSHSYDYDKVSAYFDVIKVDDGYIVIGAKYYNEEKTVGLIIKYDNNLKIVKEQEYSLLNKTILRKIIKDNDNYIVIGQSQYEEDRIGNHLGGGIILKIDNDINILEQNNYGGNKSGYFCNIYVLPDSYLVTGYDADYPIIVKFNKSFNREVDDTDLISKKVLFNKTFEKGNNKNINFSYNSILYNNKIYFINGNYNLDNDESVLNKNINDIYLIDNDYLYTSEVDNDNQYVIIYDLNYKEIDRIKIDIDNINQMILDNDKILIVGLQSNKEIISPKLIFIDRKYAN